MICPNCGANNAPGAKFCVGCGANLATAPQQNAQQYHPQQYPQQPVQQYPQQPAQAAPKKPSAPAAKVDFGIIKNTFVGIFAPIGAKIKGLLSNKKILGGVVSGAVLLLAIIIVCAILGSGNGFIQRDCTILLEQTGKNEFSVIVDNKALKDTIEVESEKDTPAGEPDIATSMDGKVAAILSDDGQLYVVKGKKLKEVASDVVSFELSVNGKYLAYATREEDEETTSLFLCKVSKPTKAEEITDELASSYDYAVSPDGKTVAYYVEGGEDEENELMLFKGGKSDSISDEGGTLFGLSNGGKYIYVGIADKIEVEEDEDEDEDERDFDLDSLLSKWEYNMYCYNKKGDREKLGTYSSEYGVRFNDDHTQMMFIEAEISAEGSVSYKTYISNKGKKPDGKASSDMLGLIIPKGSASVGSTVTSSVTYPVSSMFDHVYSTDDAEVWMIKKNSAKNEKLVSNASSVQLDQSAEYLYYRYKSDELRMVKISHGDKASEKYVTIIKDDAPASYYVTSDRKLVYFKEKDALYCTNGKKAGIPKEVADDLESGVTVGANDVAYYILDGDLYASTNGKKGKKIISDAKYVYSSASGNVYAASDDVVYGTTGAKKLKKIVEIDN